MKCDFTVSFHFLRYQKKEFYCEHPSVYYNYPLPFIFHEVNIIFTFYSSLLIILTCRFLFRNFLFLFLKFIKKAKNLIIGFCHYFSQFFDINQEIFIFKSSFIVLGEFNLISGFRIAFGSCFFINFNFL